MLKVESDGPVLRLTLDRPEVRNALNDELIGRLYKAMTELPTGTRAVVIAGNGPAFCAGADLNWMRQAADYSEAQSYEDALVAANLFQAIVDCPAVVIARVHGACFGGGCGLVAAADLAVAAEDSTFAFSEVRLGLIPATISRVVVPKIGPGYARALFAAGTPFSAMAAQRMGLIHAAVPANGLDKWVSEKLAAILRNGPGAVAAAKALAIDPPPTPEAAAIRLAEIRATDEAKEGIRAFLEKRTASFVTETGGR